MSQHCSSGHIVVIALALAVSAATPASASAQTTQGHPGLLSLAAISGMQPCIIAAPIPTGTPTASRLSNTQRWYFSFLTQQRVIAAQAEELTERLRQDLIGTEEFLEKLDPLLERADKLYSQWKTIGAKQAERLSAGETRTAGPVRTPPVLDPKITSQSGWSADGELRSDAAVGKCLNYLRLSIVNLFLGYSDSNGRQIEDAERQAGLSGIWRSKSLSLIRALEPATGRPES